MRGTLKKIAAGIVSALLAAAYMCTAYAGSDSKGESVMRIFAAENELALYDPDSTFTEERLQGGEFAVQFSINGGFGSVGVYVAKATASGSKGSLTAALYRWNGGYGRTVKTAPVCTQSFSGLAKGDWAVLDIAELTGGNAGSGEYLLLLNEGKGNIHLGVTDKNSGLEQVRSYMNASEMPGDLLVKLGDAAGTLSGSLTANENVFNAGPDTWVATDGLGREVVNSYSDTRREGKYVGIFFHTWHTHNSGSGTRNITSILKEHPEIRNDFSSPFWGNAGAYFWNEPVWGYYRSDDEWVLRKQAELLADAGIDVVFFDNTNGTNTFINDVLTLCRVWSKARADGVKTPQISFMLPMFDYELVAVQLREIYAELYGKGIYKDLWFYWKGKPLMIGYPGRLSENDPADAEILDFFNYRVINHSQSADNVQVMNEDGTPQIMGAIQQEVTDKYQLWNWISVYPQLVNKNPDGTPEQVAVAIAHNWCAETHLTAMNNPKYQVFGRHYDPVAGAVDTRENAKLYGAYFSAQWEYALKVDPEFIWVTGWNEWVAGRFEDFLGVPNAFPDNFSDEYSRDIEPSRGDLKDHYYYLLVSYVRRFKGMSAAAPAAQAYTVDISDPASWDNVETVYGSYSGDVFDRDAIGYVNNETRKNYTYTDTSGRNDITGAKAAYDADNVYFMAETLSPLTPYTDPAWMRLFIQVVSVNGEAAERANWESFQYIVNRESPADGTRTVLERSLGGWNWENAGEVSCSISGNRLSVAVPRALLGLQDADFFVINFKWADNLQNDGDPLDFYVSGDTAPEGRFKYQFAAGKTPGMPSDWKNTVPKWVVPAAITGSAAVLAAAAALAAVKNKKKKGE